MVLVEISPTGTELAETVKFFPDMVAFMMWWTKTGQYETIDQIPGWILIDDRVYRIKES